MENSNVKLSSVALRFGLIGALISVIFSMIIYFLGMQQETWQQFIPYGILLVSIVMAIKIYKEQGLGNIMTMGQGFKVGALTTIVLALITMVWIYMYMKFIDPDVVEMAIDKQVMQMEDRGMSDEEIEQALSFSEKFMTPPAMAFMGAVVYAMVGFLFSLIASAIMQKK